jgi:acylphosphatase
LSRGAALLESLVCGPPAAPAVQQGHQAKRYFVSGIVQGVGFRYFVRQVAGRLGIAGYAKNLRDGRVEVYAIASAETLDALRGELKRGPRGAMVSGVAEEDVEVHPEYAHDFSIERDAW